MTHSPTPLLSIESVYRVGCVSENSVVFHMKRFELCINPLYTLTKTAGLRFEQQIYIYFCEVNFMLFNFFSTSIQFHGICISSLEYWISYCTSIVRHFPC